MGQVGDGLEGRDVLVGRVDAVVLSDQEGVVGLEGFIDLGE